MSGGPSLIFLKLGYEMKKTPIDVKKQRRWPITK